MKTPGGFRATGLLLGLVVGLFGTGPQAAAGQESVTMETSVEAAPSAKKTLLGAGVRFRGIFVPESAFEWFVEEAPGSLSRVGAGVEGLMRRGNFDLALSFSWANLAPEEGIWLDEPDHNPSLFEFDGFSWLSLDIYGIWRWPIDRTLAFRTGMGIGVGIPLGNMYETDYVCPTGQLELRFCMQSPTAKDIREKKDLPPVVPILDAILGLQVTLSDQVFLNIDGGLQTALFFGVSLSFFFE